MSAKGKRAMVIGSGFGGLASALRLRALGYETAILEKNEQPGGRASVIKRQGYTFDTGPSVITAPFLIDELFELFGARREDRLDLRPLHPWYRFQGVKGFRLDYSGDPQAMEQAIEAIHAPDIAGFKQLLNTSKDIYDVGFTRLSHVPFHSLKTFLACIPDMIRLRAEQSVYRAVCRHFEHPMLRRAFSLQPLLIGGNPLRTTSIYLLIHYLERAFGVHYVMGGTGALVQAFADLFTENGGELRVHAEVASIDSANGAVTGVTLKNGERLPADVVVANADPGHVYANMLNGGRRRRWTTRKLSRLRYSMGLYVLLLGTRKQWPDVAHHTIILGRGYRETLKDIFDRKLLPKDPSLYLHRPTATDPAMAPAGHDAMYALMPVPNLQGGVDWERAEPAVRAQVIELLERTALPGLSDRLDYIMAMTPEDFRQRYHSPQGAGFSIQPLLTQSAWFRFHNKSEEVRGLYFAGAGTHPGAGVPGVLSSAKVVENILKAEGRP